MKYKDYYWSFFVNVIGIAIAGFAILSFLGCCLDRGSDEYPSPVDASYPGPAEFFDGNPKLNLTESDSDRVSYLPMIRDDPCVPIGAQIEGYFRGREKWLRNDSIVEGMIKWSEIEQERGVYDWDTQKDEDFKKIDGRPFVLQVKNSPEWARKYPEYECSPPKREYFVDYAAFVLALIDRYDDYTDQLYIEVWNEPDVDRTLIGPYAPYFGCWGEISDPYYGGEYYGQFLATIYPMIKSERPDVTILAGALSLGGGDSTAFWQGAMKYRGNYDGVSYHAYAYYQDGQPGEENEDWQVIKKKATHLRWLGEDAPLYVTETSLLCNPNWSPCYDPGIHGFRVVQGEYLRHIIREVADWDVEFVLWYTIANNGWLNSDLVWQDEPQPAYFEYLDYSCTP